MSASRIGIDTGRRIEIEGSTEAIDEVWPEVKKADGGAVVISVPSSGTSVIGTDDSKAGVLARVGGDDRLKVTDTGRPPYRGI